MSRRIQGFFKNWKSFQEAFVQQRTSVNGNDRTPSKHIDTIFNAAPPNHLPMVGYDAVVGCMHRAPRTLAPGSNCASSNATQSAKQCAIKYRMPALYLAPTLDLYQERTQECFPCFSINHSYFLVINTIINSELLLKTRRSWGNRTRKHIACCNLCRTYGQQAPSCCPLYYLQRLCTTSMPNLSKFYE